MGTTAWRRGSRARRERLTAAAVAMAILLSGCSLLHRSSPEGGAPGGRPVAGSELGLPRALASTVELDGAPDLTAEQATGLPVQVAEQLVGAVVALRVAGRRSLVPRGAAAGPGEVAARVDTAGLVQALDDDGRVLANAVYVNVRGRKSSAVPVDVASTAFTQLVLMPPFATSDPAEIVLLRLAAQQSPALDELARYYAQRAGTDPGYLTAPDERGTILMATLIGQVHQRMQTLVAALPRPAARNRAAPAALLAAVGPGASSPAQDELRADECQTLVAQELVAAPRSVASRGTDASTGICFRPPQRSESGSLQGEDELLTVGGGRRAMVGFNESPSWGLVTRAGSANLLGLVPATAHTIPGPQKVIEALQGAALAPLVRWQETTQLYLSGELCRAMDLVGFALPGSLDKPDYCSEKYRKSLADEINREVLRGFQQLAAMADKNATGHGGIVLDPTDVKAGLLITTAGGMTSGVAPDAYPPGGDFGPEATRLGDAAALLSLWTQSVKPGYELSMALHKSSARTPKSTKAPSAGCRPRA